MTEPTPEKSPQEAQASPESMRMHMKLPNIPCPAFSADTFRRQMLIDSLCRWGLFAFFVLAMILLSPAAEGDPNGSGTPTLILAIGSSFVWIAMSSVNTSVARQIPVISHWIEVAPAQAESLLATSLQRKPLHHAVRMMLYQRLATLRFRQGDYAQAAAICAELLRQPSSTASSRMLQKIPGLGVSASSLRPSLLLMLAESHLLRHDFYSAHLCLLQLHQVPLNIAEQLHRNALQTRYEVGAGLYAAAVSNLPEKIRMAELMPTPQSGSIHAMLALAAYRVGNQPVADWLFARAQLLCLPEQLASLRTQGLA